METFQKLVFKEIPHKKVTIRHIRNYDRRGNLDPRGGMTIVAIATDDVGVVIGISKCNSLDNYNRKIGFEIAFARASAEWEIARVRKHKKHSSN